MTRSFAVFIFACISLGPALAVANGSRRPNSSTPCSQVRIEGEITPKLNDSELRWICGDSKSAAYRDVPPYQAAFHMRSFLDNRGYVLAEFKIENGILVVHPGEAVKVATIEVTPPDAKLEQIAGRFRGKPLRPSLLNAMESSLQRQLLETGYSCATVASQARAGDVSLKVVPGPMSDFSAFSADSIPGLESEALERFRPFEKDSTYDIRLVEL
ncbi:MAG: POTRA domain-containing protein, partial [Bdellovibrionota bacterium]